MEGYLVSKNIFSSQHAQKLCQMEMLDKQKKPYVNWGSINYVMCPCNKQWQKTLSEAVNNVSKFLGNSAVYID